MTNGRNFTFVAAGIAAVTGCSAASEEPLYQRGGEWEIQSQLVSAAFPNLPADQAKKMASDLESMNEVVRECLASRDMENYPKIGDRFADNSCIYTEVEKPGTAIRRRATCEQGSAQFELITTGTMNAESYEFQVESRSLTSPGNMTIGRETGKRLGACPPQKKRAD